jgi:deoxyribonuclease-4
MIRFGFAGIPLSCKGRTYKDGIIYAKNNGLDAIEVELIKGERTLSEDDARELRVLSESLDIELYTHAPYYTNLAGDELELEASRKKILSAGKLAQLMGSKILVIHLAMYNGLSSTEVTDRVVKEVRDLRNNFLENGITAKIGLETMGRKELFGSLDEVVGVCKRVKETIPVLDFGHIHAREKGGLQDRESIEKVFNKVTPLNIPFYLIHLSGTISKEEGEYYHTSLKRSNLKFEPIFEILLEREMNAAVISQSPLLEHEAVWLQILFSDIFHSDKKIF